MFIRQRVSPDVSLPSMEQATESHVAEAGAVTGSVLSDRRTRTVVITATEGWSGKDWDSVAKACNAHDDYVESDYRELADGREQWRIVYRKVSR